MVDDPNPNKGHGVKVMDILKSISTSIIKEFRVLTLDEVLVLACCHKYLDARERKAIGRAYKKTITS